MKNKFYIRHAYVNYLLTVNLLKRYCILLLQYQNFWNVSNVYQNKRQKNI